MRLYITLTSNKQIIPFNYQQLITGAIHRWLGRDNRYHGKQGLFCFSWLQNVSVSKSGIDLNTNSYFFISSYDTDFIRELMKGIIADPVFFCGSNVSDIQIINSKELSDSESFTLASPLFVKRRLENGKVEHAIYSDPDFDYLLVASFKNKLAKAGLDTSSFEIEIDRECSTNKTKLIEHKGIFNRVNFCPVKIKGTSDQIHFAWCVGLGHSTGIGFGALK